MAPVKVFGPAQSTNVAREVGAEYEVVNVDFTVMEHKSPEHLKRNPFGQIPAFQDGDLYLFAMVDVWTEVETHQYNSAISPIVYECIINPAMRGIPTNQKVVDESVEKLKKVLEEARLSQSTYLAGDFVSFADLNHFPYTFYFMGTPYASLFDSYPHVKAWWERLMARPSVKKLAAGMAPQ
uniref:glutathione transferase n=1 Tax=Oryza meridionalis TaxID=40149 RepID=A0A0E0C214_9ORYZ